MTPVAKNIFRTFVSAVCAGIVFACIACKPDTKDQPPPAPAIPVNVTVARVIAGPVAATLEVNGTLQPLRQTEVVPGSAGRVVKALVKEGEAVKSGQILFLLDRDLAQAAGLPTTAKLASPHAAKSHSSVRSPLAGVVLARFSNPGDMVTAAPPTVMALVADIDLLKFTALSAEERLAEVRVGQEATVTADVLPGRGFGGRVALIAAVEEAAAKMAQLEILVDNRDHALQPGTSVQARVFTAFKPRTILVPPAALIAGTVTVAEGGVARPRPVQTGIRSEEAVEVLSGVSPGDLVVVSGNKNLSDGARINYKTP